MNKDSLIEIASEKTGLERHEVAKVIDTALQTIAETLRSNESVKIRGFGTWLVEPARIRSIYDFKLKKKVSVQPKTKITFRAGKGIRA